MASLVDEIKKDLDTALKEGDGVVVSTLRFLLSAINNKTIELQRELIDEETIQVIAKQEKERLPA